MSSPDDFNAQPWRFLFGSLIGAIRAGAPRLERLALRQIRAEVLKTTPTVRGGRSGKSGKQVEKPPKDLPYDS